MCYRDFISLVKGVVRVALFDRHGGKKSELTIGGKSVKVIHAPRPQRTSRGSTAFGALRSLWNGMKVTWRYFSHPSTWVTRQYPENRQTLKLPERFRAQLRLKYDENGEHNCTGCKICDVQCPNASIKVIDMRGESGKKEIDRFIWRMDICTFCNICVMVCPFDALEMANDFEASVYDKKLLTYQLNRYAGPTKKFFDKMENKEDKPKMMFPRVPYEGPTPLGRDVFGDVPSPEGEQPT
ncbi:MAG: 4Fe-4S binding protein [Bdellovibrionaceae bacterium]|nr:4Fe-4S binding protein [Pseudobdellovibrionaceae bacterium]